MRWRQAKGCHPERSEGSAAVGRPRILSRKVRRVLPILRCAQDDRGERSGGQVRPFEYRRPALYHRRRRTAPVGPRRPAMTREDATMTTSYAGYRVRQRPSTPARALPSPLSDFFAGRLRDAEALLAAPFKGVTTD